MLILCYCQVIIKTPNGNHSSISGENGKENKRNKEQSDKTEDER